MKKFYKLLSLIVLLAMVFFALSCSEKAEMPTDPKDNNYGMLELNFEDQNDIGKDTVIYFKLEENKRIHILERILWGIENNKFSFVSEHAKIVYRNKIEAVILMYHRNNFRGCSKIIEKDILPKIESIFSNRTHYLANKLLLGTQKYLFDNPEIPDEVTISYKIDFGPLMHLLADLLRHMLIKPEPSVQCPAGYNHAGEGGVIREYLDSDGNVTHRDFYGECTCFI